MNGAGPLTLGVGGWYGWQMLPGYADPDHYDPYFSPIRVDRVQPRKTGTGLLRLSLWNAGYAEGVQDFQLDLRILNRAPTYLVANLVYEDQPDHPRSAVISVLTLEWLQAFCRWFDTDALPTDDQRKLGIR